MLLKYFTFPIKSPSQHPEIVYSSLSLWSPAINDFHALGLDSAIYRLSRRICTLHSDKEKNGVLRGART